MAPACGSQGRLGASLIPHLQGPFSWKRPEPTAPPADYDSPIRNFYEGYLTREQLDARRAANNPEDIETGRATTSTDKEGGVTDSFLVSSGASENGSERVAYKHKAIVGPKPEGAWWRRSLLVP
ncbi:hypothetical protein RRF57_011722 [Xylaria bambusicola]|uniref:Uncharacterized protein n=1 Tax=Xylaria bambusicola TaxID=326684 RepID=A0AAN7UNB9_9PEZI